MHQPLPRRTLLRTSGVCIALPWLESMSRATAAGPYDVQRSAKRLVAIGVPFGFDPEEFVPATVGRDYEVSPHLKHIAAYRDKFSVISGLSHPATGSGMHKSEAVMLTGAPYPDYSHNLRNTISIDQQFAAHFYGETRFSGLVLTTYNGTLSYTSNGVAVPAIKSPSQIFAKLFLSSTANDADEEIRRIDEGRSLLDTIGQQARSLSRRISQTDRHRVDEYFNSVRNVERQLQLARKWVKRRKPAPIGEPPQDIADDALQSKKLGLMLDMVYLALVTDSTRTVTIKTFGMHHEVTHHGKEPDKLAQCRAIEVQLLKAYGNLLQKLESVREGQDSLLDSTMVLMTSNLRDGNTHWTHDLPVLLAGGGFQHGRHLSFNPSCVRSIANANNSDRQPPNKSAPTMGVNQKPLCNLFVSILQNAGIEADRFGSSSGNLTGLS